jgi:histidinol-phosphate aminotransferase
MTLIKLSSNESPFGPSPRAVEAMQTAIALSHIYPDTDAKQLSQRLAERHQVQPEQVVVTAGLTALLDILCRAHLSPGLNAVTSRLSFIVYGIAIKAAGGRLVETAMRNNGFDLDALAASNDKDTRIVFVANPNNPTGTLLAASEMDRFVDRIPENVVLVIDEAYSDFAQHFAKLRGTDYSHSLNYVRQGCNVLVLRTFSKAHGLAALRVGYGIGPAKLISQLSQLRPTFSVSSVAQAAALAAIEDETHTRKALENNAQQSKVVIDKLSSLGFSVAPTWGNFLYFDLGEDSTAFAKQMKAEGVMVRPLGPWGAPTAIRLTIGTPEQNAMFLGAFEKIRAQSAKLEAKR